MIKTMASTIAQINIWDLPLEERDAYIETWLQGYDAFLSQPDEEREKVYYATFLGRIKDLDEVVQTELKEEYQSVYSEMLTNRDWIEEQKRAYREKYPNGLPRSYANCYKKGNFTVFWAEKQLVYNA